MHVWRNVIRSGKKLYRREIKPKSDQQKGDNPNDTTLTIKETLGSKQFFKYVFISRNTWILGFVKHIEITLIGKKKHALEKYDHFTLNIILAAFGEVLDQILPQLCNFMKFLLQK